MIELSRLTAEALIVLAGAVIYLGGIGLWLFAQRMSRFRDGGYLTEDEQAQTLSRLSHSCRVQFVIRGEEAELREISEQVNAAEPPMPECPREDIDFHFLNRAN